MKFPFEKLNRTSVWERFGDIDLALLGKYLDTIKEGKEMELIIREKIDWDADKNCWIWTRDIKKGEEFVIDQGLFELLLFQQ